MQQKMELRAYLEQQAASLGQQIVNQQRAAAQAEGALLMVRDLLAKLPKAEPPGEPLANGQAEHNRLAGLPGFAEGGVS